MRRFQIVETLPATILASCSDKLVSPQAECVRDRQTDAATGLERPRDLLAMTLAVIRGVSRLTGNCWSPMQVHGAKPILQLILSG